MRNYRLGRNVSDEDLRASVLAAVPAITAAGLHPTVKRLQERGVRGDTRRISATLADLIRRGELPATCLRDYRTHGNARTIEATIPPRRSHTEPARPLAMPFHAPEVQPQSKIDPPVWEWMRERYWTDTRRKLYQRGGIS